MIKLDFRPNNTEHGDVVLTVGDWSHTSDSYYYALDKRPKARSDVRGVMRKMLGLWQQAVLSGASPVYLPHAFYDQCSGWIRVENTDGMSTLTPGWSDKEGYAFYPTDFEPTWEIGFRPDDYSVRMETDQLVEAIEHNVKEI